MFSSKAVDIELYRRARTKPYLKGLKGFYWLNLHDETLLNHSRKSLVVAEKANFINILI